LQTLHSQSRKSTAPLRYGIGPRPKPLGQQILGFAVAAPQDDLRPLHELTRLRSAATDPLELGPIRIAQRNWPRSPSHAKLRNRFGIGLQANGYYIANLLE
jgi:hypothetical protein